MPLVLSWLLSPAKIGMPVSLPEYRPVNAGKTPETSVPFMAEASSEQQMYPSGQASDCDGLHRNAVTG